MSLALATPSFAQVSDLVSILRADLLGSLLLATILGALIGWEREVGGKPAGLRTTILICAGAALFTDLSLQFGRLDGADGSRVAAQVVTGIGFLGAGSIIQSRGRVLGLTTAATIWVVAAIGMAAGAGAHVEAVGATLLVLLVLAPVSRLEGLAMRRRRARTVWLAARTGEAMDSALEALAAGGLQAVEPIWAKDDASGAVTATLLVKGPEARFGEVRKALARRDAIVGIRVT